MRTTSLNSSNNTKIMYVNFSFISLVVTILCIANQFTEKKVLNKRSFVAREQKEE